MATNKKIILIIVALLVIAGGVGLFYVARGGFTAKQRYENCAETCRDLMILNSSIPACLAKCEEITGYNPTAAEKEEAAKRGPTNTTTTTKTNTQTTTNKSTTTNTSITNTTKTTNTTINTNAAVDYEDREYYCNWVWYQEIIDKNTKELIYECPSDRPWCNYADGTYEKVGCCEDAEHTDCITLPNL